ncbi:MAG: FmdE family protein, partial [Candidatus Methylomirabilales bacterium]
MLGCRAVGLDEPREGKRLLVYVEINRCATDAIQSVTGCSLGKRTLRHVDYGKTAATFVNLVTGRAVRVIARESSREFASLY